MNTTQITILNPKFNVREEVIWTDWMQRAVEKVLEANTVVITDAEIEAAAKEACGLYSTTLQQQEAKLFFMACWKYLKDRLEV